MADLNNQTHPNLNPDIKIAVLGAGSWGTALGSLLSQKYPNTWIWAREPQIVEGINSRHQNPVYVNDQVLPIHLKASNSLLETIQDSQFIICVIPSHGVREVFESIRDDIHPDTTLVCASKGIEIESLLPMNEVLQSILSNFSKDQFAFLSGPSFALEVLQKMPTAVTIASSNEKTANTVQELFYTDFFRTYSSTDVVGVELGGALKNVIAIAAGICDGMELGHNSRAALITRGLGEIAKLGSAMGADPLTFLGLSGMGDLILTCTGGLSRNRRVGIELGKGRKLKAILEDMTMVAEGVKTSKAVHLLAKKLDIEMYICSKIYEILFEDANPKDILPQLMTRSLKSEFTWAQGKDL